MLQLEAAGCRLRPGVPCGEQEADPEPQPARRVRPSPIAGVWTWSAAYHTPVPCPRCPLEGSSFSSMGEGRIETACSKIQNEALSTGNCQARCRSNRKLRLLPRLLWEETLLQPRWSLKKMPNHMHLCPHAHNSHTLWLVVSLSQGYMNSSLQHL